MFIPIKPITAPIFGRMDTIRVEIVADNFADSATLSIGAGRMFTPPPAHATAPKNDPQFEPSALTGGYRITPEEYKKWDGSPKSTLALLKGKIPGVTFA